MAKRKVETTTDDWLRVLEEAQAKHGDEGMTLREIASSLSGRRPPTPGDCRRATHLLEVADLEGRLIVGRAPRPARDGTQRIRPVYRVESK
jgi:hypothetical protein